MVRGHFLGGYFRPNIVTWILQGCLDGSYHVAPTVCQADDYPLRGHTGSAMRSPPRDRRRRLLGEADACSSPAGDRGRFTGRAT